MPVAVCARVGIMGVLEAVHSAGVSPMQEIKDALLRATGIILMVLGGLAGAATCGYSVGQNHPVEAT